MIAKKAAQHPARMIQLRLASIFYAPWTSMPWKLIINALILNYTRHGAGAESFA